ncbi:hypothetical protein [Bacteroides sp.]|uniref:hypothetical protein n=1 Tax=Bacteroides sp. TaxID=29523 RepID=UPI0026065A7F|nr:hypothetical protein [Bacteroides sp.]MDD3039001.1 hypothetical protein [Bacteroides sp.]
MPVESAYKINHRGDLDLTRALNGFNMNMTVEQDKLQQDVWIILKTIKGSYPLNPDFGVDYKFIMNSGYQPQIIRSCMQNALDIHPAKLKITEFNTSPPSADRRLHVWLKLKTKNSDEITITTELPSL